MRRVLEIGAAENPDRGYAPERGEKVTRVDIQKGKHVDVIHDLEKFPYPFKSNTFDKVYASHVLEHLNDTLKVMSELHRICKPGARIVVLVPHFSGYTSWSNPDHKKAFAADAFRRLGPKFRVKDLRLHYTFSGKGRSIPVRAVDALMNSLAKASPRACERFWCYLVGGFTEIYCELEVMK